ncbi:murein biosynthesis integral membrane protein MurJ, partial [bacterium]|nr:murein biosynthesis integral membrane protein MurJ [bacterium]
VKLLRFLFPYIGFMALATWCSSILNSHRKFFLPALAPAFLNLGWLGGALMVLWKYSGATQEKQAIIVAAGVLLGGFLQFIIQIPMLRHIGFKFVPKIFKKIPAIVEIGKLLTPALFGLAVAEINFLVDVFLASYLPEGSVAALTYANRLIFLPMGLASVAMATATLPELSTLAARKDFFKFNRTLSFSFRTLLSIMLPISAYILAMNKPIVRFLFERGSFSGTVSTPMTAYALAMYGIGLYAFSSFKILTQGFYALKDTKTPVVNAAIALLINIVLNLILIGPMKHAGLALASSLASIVQVFFLIWWLHKRGVMNFADEMKFFSKVVFASAVLWVIVWFSLVITMKFVAGTSFIARTIQLIIPSIVWFVALISIAYVLKIDEVINYIRELLRKLSDKIFSSK